MGRWGTHLIVLSLEPETIVLPSMLIATLETSSECPSSLAFSLPVSASQILQVGHSSMISTWILMWKCDQSDRKEVRRRWAAGELTGLFCRIIQKHGVSYGSVSRESGRR